MVRPPGRPSTEAKVLSWRTPATWDHLEVGGFRYVEAALACGLDGNGREGQLSELQTVDVRLFGSADTLTVDNLAGADVTNVRVDLAAPGRRGTACGASPPTERGWRSTAARPDGDSPTGLGWTAPRIDAGR
jgi:hypothetical protein